MSSPFTSETYENIWKAHYCKGEEVVSFDFIKGAKFIKKGSLPLFINLGSNFTNGMTYTIDESANDFQSKVALIHDVHTRDAISYESTERFKLIKIAQYPGCYADISSYKTSDDILSACFNSSKSKYNFRRSLKLLEEGKDIAYKTYYGDIEKETYQHEMQFFKELLSRRFDDKNTHNTVLPMWDFYEELIYPMIQDKQVALNVIYDRAQPIAMSINFIDDNTLIIAMRTFDIDYNKMNIGNIEVYKLLEWSIKNGIKTLDFSKGIAEYKKRWTNDMYEFHHHILYDSKSILATTIAKSLAHFFTFKQYLRDKNVNEWYVRFIHLKKKILFQK